MALWNVMYDDRRTECRGRPFAVGDEVAWQPVAAPGGGVPRGAGGRRMNRGLPRR
ncbi:DUF6578 domain-containing protein [Streptomyces sp. NPDC088360]|uniref:DUF6578 domain-containing protein n=1 Tax=Streptomyces sp. NPDC088360 TaxID=3154515 RepID=UPI003450C15A